jgi:hypothetical protein
VTATIARHFLTDTELDAVMAALPGPEDIPVGTLDQVQAATSDLARRAPGVALRSIAGGGWAYLGPAPTDTALSHRMHRIRLRMILAAFSAGVTHLCEHTQQIRPMLLTCDPPALVCMQGACLDRADATRAALGFHWDNLCDACGRYTEMVTAHLSSLGPLTISAHLCGTCVSAIKDNAIQAADHIQAVGRKSPCPCGSGRRFKRCHGSVREAS